MIGYKLWSIVAFLVALTNCNVINDPTLQGYAEGQLVAYIKFLVVFAGKSESIASICLAQAGTTQATLEENKGVDAGYVPRGRVVNIGNLPVYEAPDNVNSRRMLIGVYDIAGFSHPNMQQITDLMALEAGGFRAVLPDFFRGQSWDFSNPIGDLAAWLQRVGNWDTIVRPDLINVVRYYQSQGVQEFAIFGMCWGGRIGTSAAIELSDYFKAIGIVHPSNVNNNEASLVRVPMYLLPSSAQPDMLPFYQVLRINFGDNSGHRRFNDMPHGFAGASGNFSNPINQMHVNEVIRTLGVFFARNLSNA